MAFIEGHLRAPHVIRNKSISFSLREVGKSPAQRRPEKKIKN
jgi:hypothetical protein